MEMIRIQFNVMVQAIRSAGVLGAGTMGAQIAAHLASTEQAIETHMALIMRIFDIRSRNELIRFADELGFI